MIEIVAVILGVILTCVAGVTGYFAVKTFSGVEDNIKQMNSSVGEMAKSVATLNVQMGSVITEMAFNRRDIEKNTIDIERLKETVRNGIGR